ncbi:hypothetical protein ARMSODRAFT_980533 [Armillaria solidipes]|uniref:Uncharacterized protein n=1 Tax=Armillaria solidipes TaxID=1076256 RepID=A0A2H3B6N8_9AGAR|nr:hypothetical protein ARMSODRAFT_980533 [Armillaria solidipes]
MSVSPARRQTKMVPEILDPKYGYLPMCPKTENPTDTAKAVRTLGPNMMLKTIKATQCGAGDIDDTSPVVKQDVRAVPDDVFSAKSAKKKPVSAKATVSKFMPAKNLKKDSGSSHDEGHKEVVVINTDDEYELVSKSPSNSGHRKARDHDKDAVHARSHSKPQNRNPQKAEDDKEAFDTKYKSKYTNVNEGNETDMIPEGKPSKKSRGVNFGVPTLISSDLPLFGSEFSDPPDPILEEVHAEFSWAWYIAPLPFASAGKYRHIVHSVADVLDNTSEWIGKFYLDALNFTQTDKIINPSRCNPCDFALSTNLPTGSSPGVASLGTNRHVISRLTNDLVVFIFTGFLSEVSHLVDLLHKNAGTAYLVTVICQVALEVPQAEFQLFMLFMLYLLNHHQHLDNTRMLTLQLLPPTEGCSWSSIVFATPRKGAAHAESPTKGKGKEDEWMVPVDVRSFKDGIPIYDACKDPSFVFDSEHLDNIPNHYPVYKNGASDLYPGSFMSIIYQYVPRIESLSTAPRVSAVKEAASSMPLFVYQTISHWFCNIDGFHDLQRATGADMDLYVLADHWSLVMKYMIQSGYQPILQSVLQTDDLASEKSQKWDLCEYQHYEWGTHNAVAYTLPGIKTIVDFVDGVGHKVQVVFMIYNPLDVILGFIPPLRGLLIVSLLHFCFEAVHCVQFYGDP